MSEVVDRTVRDIQLYELLCLARQASPATSLGSINRHPVGVNFQRILRKLRHICIQVRESLIISPDYIICIDAGLEPYFLQLPNFKSSVLYSDAISDFEIGHIDYMRVFSILDLQDTLGFGGKKYPILIIHKESFSSGLSRNLVNLKSLLRSMIRSNFDDCEEECIASLKCYVRVKSQVLGQLALTDITVRED